MLVHVQPVFTRVMAKKMQYLESVLGFLKTLNEASLFNLGLQLIAELNVHRRGTFGRDGLVHTIRLLHLECVECYNASNKRSRVLLI